MAHSRARYAERLLKQVMGHSPIAGIIGQRQTGKTTLADGVSRQYESLDLLETQKRAELDPVGFLKGRKYPFTIDECQYVPGLFPALKEWVRRHPARGQFILTGSIRFTSRKAIRESLTGRIVNVELLPLSLAENHAEELPSFLLRLLQGESVPESGSVSGSWIDSTRSRFEKFLQTGGLPGICFFRDEHVRSARLETQLETLLERDIRLLLNTRVPYRQLKGLLGFVAANQGLPMNYAEAAKAVRLTIPTIKSLLQAMEAMFLVRTISTDQQARPVAFLEDQGMATYLVPEGFRPEMDLCRGLFASIAPQFLYRPETHSAFYQYRTRGGAKVDLAIRTRLGRIGVLPVVDESPTPSALASARSFVSNSPKSIVVIAHMGREIRRITGSIVAVPYAMLVSDGWR